jgi:hypothetical protein
MMRIKFISAFFALSFIVMPSGASATTEATDNTPFVSGWLEYVIFEHWQVVLRAKLDTGAKTSSLHALDIKYFNRNGEPWVRFNTEDKKNDVILKAIELPLLREVKIKSHHNDAVIRPVVELHFCLDGQIYHGQFSLVDRSHFNYPVLIGRRVLKQGIIVDASSTFTSAIDSQRCEILFENGQL